VIGTLLGRTRPPGYRLELHGGVDAHHSAARRPGHPRVALIDEKEPDL
jgi:hypothetical protein